MEGNEIKDAAGTVLDLILQQGREREENVDKTSRKASERAARKPLERLKEKVMRPFKNMSKAARKPVKKAKDKAIDARKEAANKADEAVTRNAEKATQAMGDAAQSREGHDGQCRRQDRAVLEVVRDGADLGGPAGVRGEGYCEVSAQAKRAIMH